MRIRAIKFTRLVMVAIIILLALTLWANNSITTNSNIYLSDNIDRIAPGRIGLLLGTSRKLKSGKDNEYFFNRIDATVELFKNNKIKYVIVSGDNSHVNYNEPQDMKIELIKRGIPEKVIYMDFAGLRTFDSIIRAKEIFGQNEFIVISQKFHNERAVYIARKNGIRAFGYNAKDVSAFKGFKTKLREYLARDKVFIDLFIGTDPKYLGNKVEIN